MKRLISIVIICMSLALTAGARYNYDRQWREVEAALDKDLPATALAMLQTMYQHAKDEGNEPQILKTNMVRAGIAGRVSPDSARRYVEDIRTHIASESRPVPSALWHCALGISPQLLTDPAERYEHLTLALQDFEALAAVRATDYVPLFMFEAGSKAFGNDLLHILGYSIARCMDSDYAMRAYAASADSIRQRLADYYSAHGTRSAALMARLETLNPNGGDIMPQLYRLAAEYGDLAECIEVYIRMTEAQEATYNSARITPSDAVRRQVIEGIRAAAQRYAAQPRVAALHNYLSRISAPCITISPLGEDTNHYAGMPEVMLPGQTLKVVVERNNITKFSLRFEPLEPTAATLQLIATGCLDKCRAAGKAIMRNYRPSATDAPYITLSDTLALTVPDSGIYRLSVVCDGTRAKREPKRASRYPRHDSQSIPLYVSRLTALLFKSPAPSPQSGNSVTQDTHIIVVDSQTGHPVSGAQVQVYTDLDDTRTALPIRTLATDDEGRALINPASPDADASDAAYNHYSLAVLQDGLATLPILNTYESRWYGTEALQNSELKLRLYLDRSIYRPGQTVNFGGVVYTKQGDETHVVSKALSIVLRDANHRELETLQVLSDSTGNFGGTFTLPEHCLTGTFSIGCKQPRATEYFSVEAYKRPTFEVQISDPDTAYALGDSIILRGVAHTYTDLPVSSARVQYRIRRQDGIGGGFGAGSRDLAAAETLTDAQGTFEIPVHLREDAAAAVPLGRWQQGLEGQGRQNSGRQWLRHRFVVEATVTSPGGESAACTLNLYASHRPSVLTIECPETICRETLTAMSDAIVVRHTNVAGKSLGGRGTYRISRLTDSDNEAYYTGSFVVDQPLSKDTFAALPSGRYCLRAEIEDTTVQSVVATFSIFGETDTRPAVSTPHFAYVRPNAAGDSTTLMFGTSHKDAYIYYDLCAVSGYREHRHFVLSDSIVRETLTWRPEFGDGATASYAFVRDGKLYDTQISVQRPRPDKALEWQWETFRDKVQPGETQEWRLSLRYPDGKPADAVVMARLYDASLDAIRQYGWQFYHNFSRRQVAMFYDLNLMTHYLGRQFTAQGVFVPEFGYTRWRPEVYSGCFGHFHLHEAASNAKLLGRPMLYANNAGTLALGGTVRKPAVLSVEATADAVNTLGDAENALGDATSNSATGGVKSALFAEQDAVRSDFAETVFFYPALRTDSTGVCTIAFTLPQSLTQWHFSAFAHDREMCYALIDADIVARRQLMTEAKVPRFVRTGDKVSLPVTVTRLAIDSTKAGSSDRSASTKEEITLSVIIAEAASGKPLRTYSHKIRLTEGESLTQNFIIEAPRATGALSVTVRAASSTFADGERRVIPVLSDEIKVQRAIPFSLTDRGKSEVNLSELWQSGDIQREQLTVEVTSRPVWTVIAALPALMQSPARSAEDWATRLYCVSVADFVRDLLPKGWIESLVSDTTTSAWAEVLRRNPDLKAVLLEDSPWTLHAEREAERTRALKSLMASDYIEANRWSAIDKLREMQLSDGAWPWMPGMGESRTATIEVLTLLYRLLIMTDGDSATALLRHHQAIYTMIERAMAYVVGTIRAEVSEARRYERDTSERFVPTESQLRYLYLWALSQKVDPTRAAMTAEVRFLLDRARSADPQTLTMYGKSAMAVAYAAAGDDKSALATAQSLVEYTVSDAAMGRYFDTERAFGGWASYRIPTQVGVIEALQQIPAATLSYADCQLSRQTVLNELRQWLLQCRRTQIWETSRQSTDAIYALICAERRSIGTAAGTPAWSKGEPRLTLNYGRGKVLPMDGHPSGSKTAGHARQVLTDTRLLDPKSLIIDHPSEGMVWGAVFAEGHVPAGRVEAAGSGMKLARRIEVLRHGQWQTVSSTTRIGVGDRVRQVVTLRAERDYDFVCLDFGRASTLETATALSGMRHMGGTWCYVAVGDVGNRCYVEHLAKGEHTFVDEAIVDRAGTAILPPAHVQCVYAPEFGATAGPVRLLSQ